MSIRIRPLVLCLLAVSIATLTWSVPIGGDPSPVVFEGDRSLPGVGVLQREPAVAASPVDPSRRMAVFIDHHPRGSNPARDCRAYFTIGGSGRWRMGEAVPLLQVAGSDLVLCSDPAVVADGQGNFYVSYLNANFGDDYIPFDVFVAKSTDGGRTFSTHSVAVQGLFGVNDADKSWIAVDDRPGSPYRGSLYVAWTDFASAYPIEVVRSRDHAVTWSAPTPVSGPASFDRDVLGAVPVVGPDGAVTLFWAESTVGRSGTLTIQFSRSTDGGVTWSLPAPVASHLPGLVIVDLKNANPDYGTVPFAGVEAFTGPAAAASPDGTLYVAWTDAPSGRCRPIGRSGDIACTNTDVRLSYSRDAGKTWSRPVKVSDDDGGADQFFPAMAAHPNGVISLVWIDRRLDPDNIDYDAFYTNTTDGVHFLPNVRISTRSSTLGTDSLIGDYSGLAAAGSQVLAAWSDDRLSAPSIFVAQGALAP